MSQKVLVTMGIFSTFHQYQLKAWWLWHTSTFWLLRSWRNFKFIHCLYVCVWVCNVWRLLRREEETGTCLLWCAQSTIFSTHFFPFTMWVLGLKFGSSGWNSKLFHPLSYPASRINAFVVNIQREWLMLFIMKEFKFPCILSFSLFLSCWTFFVHKWRQLGLYLRA